MRVSKDRLPAHVGIIMDGNRRWATARGLPKMAGHRRGYDQAIKIVDHAFSCGVKYITLYAFSVQNWNRAKTEVDYLMRLLLKMIDVQTRNLHKKGIRVRIIGTRDRLEKKIIHAIQNAHKLTRNNTNGTLLVAFNYESRHEIVDAVKSIVRKRVSPRAVTPDLISKYLYTAGVPDPDLIIRTSGERRLSGFLLWQAAHAELYFTDILWPAFTTKNFDRALLDYAQRQRRFGR